MKKNLLTLTITITVLVLIFALLAGILWVNQTRNQEAANKLYSFNVFVGEKNYIVTVKTNWTNAPKVYLPQQDPSFISCDFIGSTRETVGFNITIPTDLIGGNISLVWKYYEQNPESFTLSNNGTHNSIQMTFTHTATDEHFEIHGTKEAG
jgi:hypothetical protein